MIRKALVAQSVERVLGKDEVGGSNPLEGSMSINHNHFAREIRIIQKTE